MPSSGRKAYPEVPFSGELTRRAHTYSPLLLFRLLRLAPHIPLVHFFWKWIWPRAPSGQPLFPNYTARNINAALKRACGKIGLPDASRYISHAFRRGAAQELKAKGAQWPTIATLGDWRSLACRVYVDIANDIDRDISKILEEEVACAADEDEQAPLWVLVPIFDPFRDRCRWGLGSAYRSITGYPRLIMSIRFRD